MENLDVVYNTNNYLKYDFLDYLPFIEKGELDQVYRPNDDSYLMIEALNLEAENSIEQGALIVEIGSGSGILINHLVSFLDKKNKSSSLAIAIDINYDANILTQKYANHYHLSQVECVNTDVAEGLYNRLKGQADVVICNPPYVPTEDEEVASAYQKLYQKDKLLKEGKMEEMKKINCIEASYAGGEDGMVVTQNMIDTSLDLLAPNGSLYIFLIFENGVESIVKAIQQERPEFKCQVLLKQRKYNELQYVLKCSRLK
ncbi:methyltransferase small domain protein (macronuclear) [Tetrahymena thermophila SB210]|uniref:Methyltransferase small domain protein n=1 Tax=Tetrahymena thermophila (strain SB210) TaxID=312017 RepID=Q23EX7_TETTS|nr:methyltransferase small domain protein [Tetrahymena thermophila SB210]EAR95128.1 methyltransferase small domain protein [Tetrahymena thermophila SB210]|eukprot:XP_001015373.1 methyltransferase small domain protein [Tetrahymena thermophila SB210]